MHDRTGNLIHGMVIHCTVITTLMLHALPAYLLIPDSPLHFPIVLVLKCICLVCTGGR